MNFLKPTIFVLTFLLSAVFFTSQAQAATRTISDAGGNWSAAGTWVEGAVPTLVDDIVATATSGNLTCDYSACLGNTFDMTNYVGTLTWNNSSRIDLAGNIFKLVSGMTTVVGGYGSLRTRGVVVPDFAGQDMAGLTLDVAGGTTTLGADVSLYKIQVNSSYSVATFNTNNYNISVSDTITGASGSINLGSSTLTLSRTSVGDYTWGFIGTLDAGTSLIKSTSTSKFLATSSQTYYDLEFTDPAFLLYGGNISCHNFTWATATAKTNSLSLPGNITVSNMITFAGNSAINRLFVTSNTLGSARTITAANVSVINADFRDIIGAGAGSWDLSAISGGSGDAGGNSGITFTTGAPQYWKHGASASDNWSTIGNWFLATNGGGGAGRVPLPQDDVVFDANSFAATGKTVVADMPRLGKSISWTGATNSPTFSLTSTPNTLYGSLTLISGMTFGQSQHLTFEGRGSYSLTSAGKVFMTGVANVNISMIGGILTLQDNFDSSAGNGRTLILNNGTFDANNFNVSCNNFSSSNSNTRSILMGSGIWTMGNAYQSSSPWNLQTITNLNLNAETSTLKIEDFTSATQTVEFGGLVYNNVTLNTGDCATTIAGSNTFNNLTINAPKTVKFTSGTTQTINGLFTATGTSGNLITINSSTPGTSATLKKTNGIVAGNYLSLQDIAATGGAAWYAGANSANVSGNTGWSFSNPPGIFYSVGQSASDLKTGTPTVTIASGAATFSAAQTGNIGVGDRVTYGQIDITTFADQGGGTTRLTTSAAHGFSQYDYITISGTTNYNGIYQITNVSDATNLDITKTYVAEAGGAAKFVGNIAYISSKTSTSVWNLINPRGGVPTDRAAAQTVVSIKHEYTSLSAAVTGAVDANHLNTTDLVTGNYQLNFPCYYDSAADTTAVTVTGYTTGASNFIKIYTPNNTTNEANFSQRHNGKWDDDRYALSGGSLNTLTIQQSYTKIMGLQVTSSSTAWTTIVFGPDYDYVEFDSCISKNTGTGYAIQLYGTDGSSVKNSIFYGSSASRVVALRFGGSVQNVFYNNTVYGSGGSENGIYTEGYSPLIKNCIVQNTGGSAYASSFDSASNYNISDDSSNTGGAQDQIETIVSFADAANKDFHLSPNDTAAKNAGADLSADANLPVTTDIDGQGRDAINGRLYDIGADQAATAIYYSVGQNTNDHKTGSPTVTIASGVATFSVAQTATNMGVGDKVTYNTTDVAYISSKTSTSVWNLVTATGGIPANITDSTVVSITHAYSSLSAAEAGAVDATHLNTTDLVAGNYQLNFPCYYDSGADTTTVTVSGYITSPSNNIKIYTPNNTTTEANNSQRHSGKWDDGRYVLRSGSMDLILANINYVYISGLQLDQTGNNSWFDGISVGGTNKGVDISNNIIKYTGGASSESGIIVENNVLSSSQVYIYNNIVYGWSKGIGIGNYFDNSAFVYNNTLYGNSNCGISESSYYDIVAINNLSYNNGSYDYCTNGSAAINYSSLSNKNLSKDASALGANAKINQTVTFADAVNKDFHLSPSDTSAKNSGSDLSADSNFTFNTDIDGQTRNVTINAWDIGADEAATAIFYSVGQNTTSHETGAGTVTVDATARTATFSVAQTATNMGVGDLVTYTGGACYITNKTSTTVWGCQSAIGAAPTAVTDADVTSIAHAYASLSAAEAGAVDATHLNTADLVAGNYQLNFPCYYDSGADTTVVTVDGYTTGPANYIKIYTPNNTTTEVNVSQRHQGKATGVNYLINPSTNGNAIALNIPYVKLVGLEITDFGNPGFASSALYFPGIKYITIDSNYIHDEFPSNNGTGISANGSTAGGAYISNNIINNVNNGMNLDSWSGVNSYAYNNTLRLIASVGFRHSTIGQAVLKNNITQNCGDGFLGTFNVTSDYNISDLAADAPGANSKNSTTVAFADAANKDFHLSPTDTAARNFGVDLSSDSSYLFTTDIDNQTRPSSSSTIWDIGADEAAAPIYYSVGQSVADLKIGTPTITITSGVATFSAAQTGNIGVGDRVTYNTTDIAYIASKTSTSVWNLVTKTGAVPADITTSTVVSIKHEYTSLSAAVTGAVDVNHLNTTGLVTGNYQLNFPCYYDSAADTTAVTVSGYTTAPANYIRIYTPISTTTEANASQRHQGKWDDGKYNLNVSSVGAYNVNINNQFVHVDGLQIKNSSTSGYDQIGIDMDKNSYVSNNILQYAGSGGTNIFGIQYNLTAGNFNLKVWNNIIYGFKKGIGGNAGGDVLRAVVYNNTVKDAIVGYYTNGYMDTILKNNIAQNCIDGFTSSNFHPSSNYNISDLVADAPGANSKNSTTVAFADPANKDFHLSTSDTAAKNSGADLSADINLAFTNDIDGQTRPSSSSTIWDIGADEAATAIYYSVGQNTTDHKTGTPTVTIASGIATFSEAQTATNMGVGDKVTYNTTSVAYISEKISTSQWKLITATGATPTNVTGQTVNSIAHTFNLINYAIGNGINYAAGVNYLNTSNLVTGNYQLNLPCYNDGSVNNTNLIISAYTTSPANYIKIYTPVSTTTESNTNQRHQGKWDDTKFRIDVNGSFQLNSSYLVADGLQFNIGNDGVYVSSGPNAVKISNSIIKSSYGASYGIRIDGQSTTPKSAYVYNNIVYGGSAGICRYYDGAGKTLYAYNNTVYGGTNAGIYDLAGSSIVAKNNIVQGSTDGYKGTFLAGSDYNISDLAADAPGANSKNSTTVAFVDAANKDFHLSVSDTVARKTGLNLQADSYLHFGEDIDGQGRAGDWDIGADEFSEVVQQSQISSPNLDAGLVGHWTFDGKDISGTTAKDTSGNNNNGTISGATKAIGKLGQGTDFSVATNVVTVPDKDNLDGMSQLTLSAWINPRTSGIGTSFGRIIEKGNGSSYNFLFVGNNLECDIGVTAVGSTTSPLSGKYNSWHHVDCVYDGANVSIYLDGVSVASAAKTGVVGSGSTAMTIGNNVAGDRTFNGKIDDVRIYNRALSANEIGQLYHFGQVEVRETGTTTIRK